MKNEDDVAEQAASLRRRAEELARRQAGLPGSTEAGLSLDEIRAALYELRVHQIELEMQNEELRRAQAELDRERARYFDLYDLAPVGYLSLSQQGQILQANLTAAKLFGVARRALVHQLLTRYIFEEDQDVFYAHRKRLIETGEAQVFDVRILTKDDTRGVLAGDVPREHRGDARPSWVQLTASSAQDGEGAPVYRVVLTDISERKWVEEALREKEEQYRAVADSSSDYIMRYDKNLRHIFANRIALEATGLPVEQYIGKTHREMGFPEHLCELWEQHIEGVFDTGKPSKVEFAVELVSGRMDLDLVFSPEFSADGSVNSVIGISRDISERKRTDEKLQADQIELKGLLDETERARRALLSVVEDQKEAEEQIRRLYTEINMRAIELEQRVAERTAQLTRANQELEAFSYSVSHDLRAPLRAMTGFSAALLDDYGGQLDERGQRYITQIQEASLRMGHLIEDLLNLSRVTRREMKLEQIDFSATARQIADELLAEVAERKIEFEIAPNLLVRVDYNLLKIALENLFGNAIKFTCGREQAKIEVGMLEQAGERVFFVRDNGVGFDLAYADKLFSPFQRLHSAREFSGSGIGLSIVQRIITRHGGRIWPEAAPDQGATFYFTFGGL